MIASHNSGGRAGATQRGGSGGGQRQQQQQRLSETLSPQQLREWFSQRGASGVSGSCPYIILTGDCAGQTCGKPHTQHHCFSRLDDAWRTEFGDEAERPRWVELLRCGVAIFDLDYDAILAAMYALSVSAEGDCYLSVPTDPGIEAAALGASESSLSGTAPAEALHTFTLDSGASRCFFQDSTPSLLSLHLCWSDWLTPTGAQSLLVPPLFSRVRQFRPAHCQAFTSPCSLQFGSSLYTLATEPSQVGESAQVSASGSVALPCSCRLLSHQTLVWHHHLVHPSLPRLHGMHSRLLVSGLPRSLPPLPPSPALPCLPCVEGRQRAAPHSSFPLTTAPLQTLHMDLWGPARVSGQGRERYFLLVVDDYTRYTTVFPLRCKGEVPDVLIPWIRAVRLQVRERFREDLPVLRLHSDRGGEFSSDLLREFCHGEGILQSFTLPASPQKNGIAEHLIGLVMEVAPSCLLARDLADTALDGDVTFDESVPFYRLFPYRSAPPPPPPLFLAPGPPPVDPLPPQGPAPSGVSQVDPLHGIVPVEVAVSSGAARGAAPGGAESEGAGSGGAETGGVDPGGAEPAGVEPGGAALEGLEPWGAESKGAEPRASGARDSAVGDPGSGGVGASRLGGAVAGGTGGAAAAGPGGARTWGTRAAGTGSVVGVGAGGAAAGDPAEPGGAGAGGTGTGGAGAGGDGAEDLGAFCAGAGGTGAGGAGARDTGAGGAVYSGTGAGGTVRPRPYFVPLLQQVLGLPSSASTTSPLLCPPLDQSQPLLQPASPPPAPSPYTEQTGGLTERRELESRPSSPIPAVRTGRRVPHPRPPPVLGTHAMALRPSSVPLHIHVPPPPESSLPAVPAPESDLARAACPTVSRLLATVATDPSFESTAASALVAELVDFAAACCLDYATALVAESESASSSSVGGGCALGTDVLEDRQEDLECLASAAAMDAEMASWKSTGTYINAVPPSRANIFDGMWIFRVKRPPGSPPAFKARYVTRGIGQRQGIVLFHTFSPNSKLTTLRVLLNVKPQRDYELHSLGFSTAFLQGSLHEEIWLRRPPGFTGTTVSALGFAPSTVNPSLFLRTDTSLPPFYVLVYIDDLIFATADTEALTLVKSELQKRHTCTNMGERHSYLGLQITRDRARRTITLAQSHMVHQVLQHFGFPFSSPQPTPLSTGHSLSAPPSDESVEPSGPYPELVGCLMYLLTCTRPDLAYPLSLLAHYVALGRHRKVQWDAAKRVLRYLCSTSGMGLVLGGRGPVVLTGHADASWVDDSATQRSSQGYTFSLGSGSVSWRSTRS
ncbi:unnamed protein product [Closterium sp. NIES-53]